MKFTGPAVTRRLASLALLGLAGCQSVSQMEDPLAPDIVQEAGLQENMLASPDTNAAARYFSQAAAREPGSADLRRGLARAHAGAGRLREALNVYNGLNATGDATDSDRLEAAFLSIRVGDWTTARAMAGRIEAESAGARGALLDALLADQAGDWSQADAAYATAVSRSPAPARMLNNWGVSRMARGDLDKAAATFRGALASDPDFFAAKNNLAIVLALNGNYRPPPVPATERERAVLMHNMGLIALRRGDRADARRLLEDAMRTHPEYFPDAARALAALES